MAAKPSSTSSQSYFPAPWPLWLNSRVGAEVTSMMNYSAAQLMKYNNYNIPSYTPVIRELGLPCPSCYIHRSCQAFVFSRAGDVILTSRSGVRTVASLLRNQNSGRHSLPSKTQSPPSTGITEYQYNNFLIFLKRKGIKFGLPSVYFTWPSPIDPQVPWSLWW